MLAWLYVIRVKGWHVKIIIFVLDGFFAGRGSAVLVTVSLSAAEWRALRAIVEGHTWEAGPDALLAAFVHDLTGFAGNGGSDEREYSRAWIRRRYGPREIVKQMRVHHGQRLGEEVF